MDEAPDGLARAGTRFWSLLEAAVICSSTVLTAIPERVSQGPGLPQVSQEVLPTTALVGGLG